MALLISLVATFFLYARMNKQFNRPATIRIVASSRALEAGTELKAEHLVLVEWPSHLALKGAASKPEDIAGRILLYSIPPNEPIREDLLAIRGAMVGLTSKIPDGMRAVAVVTNEVNNVSGYVFPGSHVDVLVTFRADMGKEPMTSTVLQNIEVLSTGERLQPDPSGKPQNVKVVTLLMAPDDAQKLMLASNEGTVQFVLRNGADQAQPEHHPILVRELQGNASALPPPAKKATAAASKATVYEVEVFDGDKKSVVKF